MFRDIEKPMEPFCVKYGMGMNSYFPLAGGLLTGKYPPPAYSAWKVGMRHRCKPIGGSNPSLSAKVLAYPIDIT